MGLGSARIWGAGSQVGLSWGVLGSVGLELSWDGAGISRDLEDWIEMGMVWDLLGSRGWDVGRDGAGICQNLWGWS